MKKIKLILTALTVLCFFNMPIIVVTAEDNLQQSQETITDEGTTTESSITKNDNNIELKIDTGSNIVENSSMIDDFVSGDISGQISAVKVDNSALATGSFIEVKTIYQDNLIDFNDFTIMDSSIDLNTATPDATNQILKIDSSDKLNIDLNTGENDFNRNTIINEVETGNIDFAANLINVANLISPNLQLTIDILNYIGDFTGDIIIEDEFLEEDAMVSIFEPMESTLLQSTENVSRNTNFEMTTGENNFSSNSYIGDITSGNTNAGYFENNFSGILNKANFFILNILGDWVGINEFAGMKNVIINSLSNAKEVSAFTILDEDHSTISEITQDSTITANANIGRNNFKENTLIGNLKTGHINLLENVLSIKPNLISFKDKLNIRVINIIGSFFGNLKRTEATDCASTNTCPVNDCNLNNTCPVEEPIETEEPIKEVIPDDNVAPSESNNEVLGVSETSDISRRENEVLGESITINPALIESGSGMGYLLYLLPLIPLLITIRLLRNPR